MKDTKIPFNPTPINPINEYSEVKQSDIHGLGLFAKKKIPKGTKFWYARPQDVLIISRDQFLILDSANTSTSMKDFMHYLLTYSFYERDQDALIFCLDNAKFVNHSFNPNSGASEDGNGFSSVALKDILPGEEITEDYSKYTLCSWLKKYKTYFDPCCW
ncbi:MAG: SET domain-containing protein [Promethearchaeota archaeon]